MAFINSQRRIHLDDEESPVEGWAILHFGKVDPELIFSIEAQAKLYARMAGSFQADIIRVVVRGRYVDREP